MTLSSWLKGSISWNSGNFIPLHFLDGCLIVDFGNVFGSKITFPLIILYAITNRAWLRLSSRVLHSKLEITLFIENYSYFPFLGYLLATNFAALCWTISREFCCFLDVGFQLDEPYSIIGKTQAT